jgi:hypothetical protein
MRRSVIFIVIFAVVFAAAYYFNQHSKSAESEIPTETVEPVEYLFDAATDGLPNSIRIDSKAGETVKTARNEENAWVLIQPEETAADQGSVEAAVSQASTLRILDRLSNNIEPDVVGLVEPEYVITLKFMSGVERKVEIGVVTPTESGYYAREEDGKILIVSKGAVDALLSLLTNPPFAVTETPAPASP